MKKRILLSVCLGVLLLVGNSLADPIPITEGQWINVNSNSGLPNGGTNGGPFLVTGPASPSTGTNFSFFTFCVEESENIAAGLGKYRVDDISHNVIKGGDDNTNDPGAPALSFAAAKLYSDWLDLVDKSNGDTNADYQKAIWYAENEIDSISGSALTLYNTASTAKSYFGVYVVNIIDGPYADRLGNNQSILVRNPVPEPISMLLFGTGLVAAGGYVRRRFKKQ